MNHYEILGIKRTATRSEIRAAYLQRVQDAHPDRHVDDPNFSEQDERFKRIHEAYEVLHDVERRRHYDRHRWIPSAGSAGKAVVTPVHQGRHDLPSEWLQRASARDSNAKTRILYRNLSVAVLIVLVGVGFHEFRRYEVEEHEGPRPAEVRQGDQANLASTRYLSPQSIDAKSLRPIKPRARTKGPAAIVENTATKPVQAVAAAANRNSSTGPDEPQTFDFGVSTVAWNDPIQQRLEEAVLDAVELEPFPGITSGEALGLTHSPMLSPEAILQAIGEDVPPLEEPIHRLQEADSHLVEYGAAESQVFDFSAPRRTQFQKRKRGRSSLRATQEKTANPSIHGQPRQSRRPSAFDAQLRGGQPLGFSSIAPELGRREQSRAAISSVSRGFPSSTAVLSPRRESAKYLGNQEQPQEPHYGMNLPEPDHDRSLLGSPYDMSLPGYKSSPMQLDPPTVPRPGFDNFGSPGLSLPSWDESSWREADGR